MAESTEGRSGTLEGRFPVAFHVDYWDNLGWPDRFARAEFTDRQRSYAARLGQDSVYTPEFIVNGREWRRGWVSDALPTAAAAKNGELSLTIGGKDNVSARFVTRAATARLTLNVALLGFNVLTDVKRGENGGRTLKHDFVVLGYYVKPLVGKHGNFTSEPAAMKSTTGDDPGALVAWVSSDDGSILQVAGGWLPASNHRLTAR